MTDTGTKLWDRLERKSSSTFLLGGVSFLVAAATVVLTMVGQPRRVMMVGQAFISAGWAAALLGLLGWYPALVERARWPARAGAVFAAIGVVTFAVMALVSLATYAAVPGVDLESLVPFLLPGVFVGSLLALVTFSAASLGTGLHSPLVALVLLVPSVIFLVNVFVPGTNTPTASLAIDIGLVLAMLALGYLLRSESPPVERDREDVEPSADRPT